MDRLTWVLSNHITHRLAIWGGPLVPLLLVAEHPRSGGTWLAHMLADYLQIPFPKYRRLPTSFEAVVHTHLSYSPRLRKAVFVKRDGRDLVVSAYFKVLQGLRSDARDAPLADKQRMRYPSLSGATGELADTRARMPGFIREWWRRPPGCPENWGDYSTTWLNHRGNVVVTSYEALRADCLSELRRMIASLRSNAIDERRLVEVVARHSFASQTGRCPGEEDTRSNKRKGIVGDWRNYFTPAAAEEFQRLAGRALIDLGYEPDDAWVSSCGVRYDR